MKKRANDRAVPDERLIAAASGGDRAAFSELVRRHEETVYRFAFKICRSRERAAEALQDTFIQVYRKIGSFDARSKFTTWLYAVVLNSCRMSRRRTKMDAALESLDEPPPSGGKHEAHALPDPDRTPVERLMDKELRAQLERAIEKLPLEYRAVFVLRDLEGASTEDAANSLGIGVEAAKSRLRRARAFLRNQLHHIMTEHGTRQ